MLLVCEQFNNTYLLNNKFGGGAREGMTLGM
jgi:hypothetical protein